MSNTKLFSTFDKARTDILDAITKYVEKHSGKIDVLYDSLYSTSLCVNKTFLPIQINICDGQCFVDYYNLEEVLEFGFKDADTYSNALYELTADELYYIIQCIYYSETLDIINMYYQCD